MQELFGIPLALDIGTFVGLLAAGATAAGGTRWLTGMLRSDRLEAEAKAELARAAADADARDAVEKYRMHNEALEIHRSLTSLEVFQAARRAETSPADKDFVVATYRRGRSRYTAFKQGVTLEPSLEDLVTSSLKAIADLFPAELASEQVQVDEQRQRRSGDRTKFRVGDSGPLSKHHTLHAIQRRFCQTNQIATRDDFERRFGALVEEIVGSVVGGSRFSGARLLRDPDEATAKHQARYGAGEKALAAKLGAIHLDGVGYIADFNVGFAPQPAGIGRAVHLRLIEGLIGRPGFEDIAVNP